jgi:Ca2+-binding EF-hand superfamily protein
VQVTGFIRHSPKSCVLRRVIESLTAEEYFSQQPCTLASLLRLTATWYQEEIQRLKKSINGNFLIMNKDNRINFELIYKLITDIQNRDVDFELEEALQDLFAYLDNYRTGEIELEETVQIFMSSLDNHWLINLFEQFESI